MPGWFSLQNKQYTQARGYGLSLDAVVLQALDRRHPNQLFQDWVSFARGGVNVDLPQGEYRVWAMLEDPGYWELYPAYSSRRVTAEGVTVVRESVTVAQWLQRYYRHEGDEDLPGDNMWQRYIRQRYTPVEFSVNVSDGQLNLGFQGTTFACALSALVVYPSSQGEQGARFLHQLWGRLESDFARDFRELRPVATGVAANGACVAAAPAVPAASSGAVGGGGGWLLFHRRPTVAVQAVDCPDAAVGDVPLGEEAVNMTLTCALGERAVVSRQW